MEIIDYLSDKKTDVNTADSIGIDISLNNNELLIKGSKIDLLELANYIVNIALSNNAFDHLHIDNSTLVTDSSSIQELIIEKTNNK